MRIGKRLTFVCGAAVLAAASQAWAQGETCESATFIGSGTFFGSTAGRSDDGDVGGCFDVGDGSPDVYYAITAEADGGISINTCGPGTNYDTFLSAHTGCPTGGGNLITCNDDACDLQSGIGFCAEGGQTYYIRVGGYFGNAGDFQLNVVAPGGGVIAELTNPANGHTYRLIGASSWTHAEATAVDLGGHLAAVNDAAENEWIRANFANFDGVPRPIWLGLTDRDVEGTFGWTTGEPVNYTNWAPGEPNNLGDEDYVHINNAETGTWNDSGDCAAHYGLVETVYSNEVCLTATAIGVGVFEGSTVGAQNNNASGCFNGSPDVYYVFSTGLSGPVTAQTCGGSTNYDTALTVHTGCPADGSNQIACNDDSCGLQSRVDFCAIAGQPYSIRVHGFSNRSGNFTLTVTQAVPSLAAGPIINPANNHAYYLLTAGSWDAAQAQAVSLGGHLATINDAAENEWVRVNIANFGGQPRALWLGYNDAASEGNFVWVSGQNPGYTNWGAGEPNNQGDEDYAHITNAETGAWNDANGCAAIQAVVEVNVLNDVCDRALPIADGTTNGSTSEANDSTDIGGCFGVGDGSPDVFYAYTAQTDGVVNVNTCAGASYDTFLSAHTGCPADGSNLITCNDDACGLSSSIGFCVEAGSTYYIRVAGFASARGNFTLTVTTTGFSTDIIGGPFVNPDNDHVYYLLDASTWESAQTAAQALGGYLATINNAAENEWVRANIANADGARSVWIGLNDAASEGNFVWANGEPVNYTNWIPGEPNNQGDEDYTHVDPNSGMWNDLGTCNLLNAVVEINAPTPFAGPFRNPANCHAYFLANASNWLEAQALADSLGGDLVTINDAAENEFVRADVLGFDGADRRGWIGLTDQTTEGTFEWIGGEPVGYINWAFGEPNGGTVENYGEIYGGTGEWNDNNFVGGEVIVGVIEIDATLCPCEWNFDGTIDSNDYFSFLADFFNNNGDIDCNGKTNSNDYFAFLDCFFNQPMACP